MVPVSINMSLSRSKTLADCLRPPNRWLLQRTSILKRCQEWLIISSDDRRKRASGFTQVSSQVQQAHDLIRHLALGWCKTTRRRGSAKRGLLGWGPEVFCHPTQRVVKTSKIRLPHLLRETDRDRGREKRERERERESE